MVVHDYSGHPFQVQLSRELTARGHAVLHVHCPSYVTGKGNLTTSPSDPPGFALAEVSLGEDFAKYRLAKRVRQEHRYARRWGEAAARFRPDIVVSANAPLLAQSGILRWCRRSGTPFVFWQQDVYSLAIQAEAERRLGGLGRWLGTAVMRWEASMLRRSEAVVCISDDFLPILAQWQVPAATTRVIENWAPLDELPASPRHNRWSAEHGLDDSKVFLYAGTLGLKHNPGLLLQLAADHSDGDGSKVVVVSEGAGADWLEEKAAERGLSNLEILGFQPYSRLPEVLASGDILVVLLEPGAGAFSVPSKVLSYHCAGRPLLAAVPAQNLAARTIERAGSGIVVEPTRPDDFLAAGRKLASMPSLRAAMSASARSYAERTFEIASVADAFEEVLHLSRPALARAAAA